MKKMEKINLLKKADILSEKDMKLLNGGEKDACGGGEYHLYSCSYSIPGASPTHAWVCATSLDSAWDRLEETLKNQIGEKISGVCTNYN